MRQFLLRRAYRIVQKVSFVDFLSLALFLFVFILTIATFIYPPATRLDFTIYLKGAYAVLHKQTLYPRVYTPASFIYPPSALVIFFPFLLGKQAVAASIWNTISLFAIVVSSLLFLTLIKKLVRVSFLFLFLSVILITEPVRETLLFGQNNGLILFFLLLFFLFTRKNTIQYHTAGGIFLGIAIAFKLFPIFLLIYLLAKKQWFAALTALAVFTLFLIMGTAGKIGYVKEYILYALTIVGTHSFSLSDQSFSSLFLFTFPAFRSFQVVATILVYSCFIVFCFFLWKKLKSSTFSDFFFFSSILGSTILVVTPMSWTHHLLFLFPFCFALFWQALVRKTIFTLFLFLIPFFLILLNWEDGILFLRSMHLQEIPLFSFHALIGLTIALFGEFMYLHFSKMQK